MTASPSGAINMDKAGREGKEGIGYYKARTKVPQSCSLAALAVLEVFRLLGEGAQYFTVRAFPFLPPLGPSFFPPFFHF